MDGNLGRAITLAALCGSKIALGPAFLAASRGWSSRRAWAAAAMGEMVLDKMGVFPARYRPSLLIPHTIAGAWVTHESLSENGRSPLWAAPLGGAVAAGVAVALPMIRQAITRNTPVPDALLGVAEDAATLGLGCRATGVSWDEIGQVARGTVEAVGEKVRQMPEAVGVGG